jgi:hypothetical protein
VFDVTDSYEMLTSLTEALASKDIESWEQTLKKHKDAKFGWQFFDDVVEVLWVAGLRVFLCVLEVFQKLSVVEMMLEKLCAVQCNDASLKISMLQTFMDFMDDKWVSMCHPLNHVVRDVPLFIHMYHFYKEKGYILPYGFMQTVLRDGAYKVLRFCLEFHNFVGSLGFVTCVKFANYDNDRERSKLKIELLIRCAE